MENFISKSCRQPCHNVPLMATVRTQIMTRRSCDAVGRLGDLLSLLYFDDILTMLQLKKHHQIKVKQNTLSTLRQTGPAWRKFMEKVSSLGDGAQVFITCCQLRGVIKVPCPLCSLCAQALRHKCWHEIHAWSGVASSSSSSSVLLEQGSGDDSNTVCYAIRGLPVAHHSLMSFVLTLRLWHSRETTFNVCQEAH